MNKLDEFLDNLDIEKEISVEDFPDIDLYMDQVIQLFERKFSGAKRTEDEKVLTKTMINNYAKAGLFFPIKNKKYSKEHLILISLIYQLKGVLSIQDIKYTLEGLNNRITEEDFDLAGFYDSYQKLVSTNAEHFKEFVHKKMDETNEEVGNSSLNNSEQLKRILLIAALTNLSNLYKRAAEQLIDEIIEGDSKEK